MDKQPKKTTHTHNGSVWDKQRITERRPNERLGATALLNNLPFLVFISPSPRPLLLLHSLLFFFFLPTCIVPSFFFSFLFSYTASSKLHLQLCRLFPHVPYHTSTLKHTNKHITTNSFFCAFRHKKKNTEKQTKNNKKNMTTVQSVCFILLNAERTYF